MSRAKSVILRIPLVGPLARWAYRLFRAPHVVINIEGQTDILSKHVTRLADRPDSTPLPTPVPAPEPEPEPAPEAPATLDELRELYAAVEPYQPLFGIGGTDIPVCPDAGQAGMPVPQRSCADRAAAIEKRIGRDIAGLKLLDLGSSLGYFSLHFAARGARATGIDFDPKAVALARRLASYDKLPATFHIGPVTPEFARALTPGEFDVALVLSLLHHVIREHGLARAQELLAELSARVPLVFVELAVKEEDVSHAWRDALPDDPMETFALCRNVDVVKLGEFPTHLSGVRRPLYLVSRKQGIVVNGVQYAVERVSEQAYAGSPDVGKRFHWGPLAFIKEFRSSGRALDRDVMREVLREIVNFENLRGRSARFPALKDYSVSPEGALLVMDRLDADNLLDLLNRGTCPDPAAVFTGVVEALRDLRAHGLYHNDVRAWNVMVASPSCRTGIPACPEGEGDRQECLSYVNLIDLGLAEPEERDDTRRALLWLARDLSTGRVSRDIGWPAGPAPELDDDACHPALWPFVRQLRALPTFDAFLEATLPESARKKNFLLRIPVLGPLARWVYRCFRAPHVLINIEGQGDRMEKLLKRLAAKWEVPLESPPPAPAPQGPSAAKLAVRSFLSRWLPDGMKKQIKARLLPKSPPSPVAAPTGSFTGPMPFNLVGYLKSEMGLGESARLCAASADAAKLEYSLVDISALAGGRADDHTLAHRISNRNPHPVNLFHVNADNTVFIYQTLGPAFFEGRYNIGYWHWELPEFPDDWRAAFKLVHEIWTPSRFVQDAIAAKSPVPVLRFPHAIEIAADPSIRRADLGLPEGRFLFLAMYDMHSCQARKNPDAAVQAFRRAFPNDPNVGLVIKTMNTATYPDEWAATEKRLREELPGLTIINRTLTRPQVYALESLSDVYVSLHRSEGFGLGLAESMCLGRPVIGTNWSGNTDFMDATNSCPVKCRLVELDKDYPPFKKGQTWAEADVEHAAWFMRRLVDDASFRSGIAAAGRETIRANFSRAAVGALYRKRLEVIARQF